MPLLTWTNEYSVNVRECDTQHRKLVDIINLLYDSMKEGRGREVVKQVIDELIDYVRTHFSYEESLMSQHGYPEFQSHKSEHNRLVQDVAEFERKFAAGETTIAAEIAMFLMGWLANHILKIDKNYGPFLNSKGIT